VAGVAEMGQAQGSELDRDIRLWIYRHFVDTGIAPSPVEIAGKFGLTPNLVEQALYRLQTDADALVLIPGSPYIWMAEPFSAIPTSFVVRSQNRRWWGNCIWDALAILALLRLDGDVSTACPNSGNVLRVTVAKWKLMEAPGLVHFAVPARDWWRNIGFT